MSDKIFNLHVYENPVKFKEHSHIYDNTNNFGKWYTIFSQYCKLDIVKKEWHVGR